MDTTATTLSGVAFFGGASESGSGTTSRKVQQMERARLVLILGLLACSSVEFLRAAQVSGGVTISDESITIEDSEVVTTQSLLAALCDQLIEQPAFCSNDMFDARFDLHSDRFVHTSGTNIGYTGEVGEPAQSGELDSAWWQWTAPEDGTVTIDTLGSDFDTFLTLAGGGVVHGLSILLQNDDAAPGVSSSQVVYAVTEGSHYQIAVDGFDTETGRIALNIVFFP